MALEKFAGVIALGVGLYWVFRDQEGTNAIIHSLGSANRSFVGNLQGGGGLFPRDVAPYRTPGAALP